MTTVEVGILDYGIGNLKSVANAVDKVGGKAKISSDVSELKNCARLIVPGVGAFPAAMQALTAGNFSDFVKDYVASGRPVLGICVGMQLLHELSNEFEPTNGLGLVSGTVESLLNYTPDQNGSPSYRLPNVGWRPVIRTENNTKLADKLLEGTNESDSFYFIHSYGASATGADVVAVSEYEDLRFAAVVARDNVVGTQFHPEKSRASGLRLLKNFIY